MRCGFSVPMIRPGSQIGLAHRLAAGLDAKFTLAAGALDHTPKR